MFGYVTASFEELDEAQRQRYASCYCGICRAIGAQFSEVSRLCLSYDMTFLALVLSSLYEPEETQGKDRCLPHPLHRRPWCSSEIIQYAADMNIALGYYSALDQWQDERKIKGKLFSEHLAPYCTELEQKYPRQCNVIRTELSALSKLEAENCANPDLPANCFGRLLAAVFTYREDHWSRDLTAMAHALGRYIYLADASADLASDRRSGSYNPFLSMGTVPTKEERRSLLTTELAACARHYEMLPLVQDKPIIDNILYSGIWLTYRQKTEPILRRTNHDG